MRVSPKVLSYVGLVDTREEGSCLYMGTLGAVRQFPLACVCRQSGLALAPTIPQHVQTMRGRKARTSTALPQRSADSTARW
jgi:hypothetical protein